MRSPQPALEAEVEVTLEEVATGTKRLLDIEGRRIEVTIPAGRRRRPAIRFSGVAPDGGDVYLRVKVKPTACSRARAPTCTARCRSRCGEALLGGEVRVRTLTGTVMLRIPPETQNGRTFRLAGKGLPKFRGEGNGDLFVKVRVVLPTGLSPEAKAAAERFLELTES